MKIKSLIVFTILFLIQNIIKASDTLRCYNGYGQEGDVFDRTEVMPSFPGGRQAFFSFIKENISNPEKSVDSSVAGDFVIKVIIDTSGILRTPVIINKGNLSYDDLDIWCDLLKKLPKWNPAKQRNKLVKCYVYLPIKFDYQLGYFRLSVNANIDPNKP